jgi:hypothetical protein
MSLKPLKKASVQHAVFWLKPKGRQENFIKKAPFFTASYEKC